MGTWGGHGGGWGGGLEIERLRDRGARSGRGTWWL